MSLKKDLTEDQKRQINLYAKTIKKTNAEKVKWKRQYLKLQEFIEKEITPIDEEIARLELKKFKLEKKMKKLADKATKECFHPRSVLTHDGTYIVCKFCNKKIMVRK